MTFRTQLALAGVIVVLLGALYLWRLQATVGRLKAERDAALNSAATAEHTTTVLDRYHTETRVITEQAEREADALHETPGADAPFDPPRRADFCARVGRLRNDPAACPPDPREPAGALPAGRDGAPADAG